MAGPTPPSPETSGNSPSVVRFDGVQRIAHWGTALLFLVLIATGAALYVPALVGLVGRRLLLVRVHFYAGLALPAPLLVSAAGPWGRALRADLRRLNRWSAGDRRWLRMALHSKPVEPVPSGTFNAGQKLNAAFVAGVIVVMLMTGCVMWWSRLWPLSWRTGATFVHDVVAYLLVAVVVGHVLMALAHPGALVSMFTGRVSRGWVRRHAPLWLEELGGETTTSPDVPGPAALGVGGAQRLGGSDRA
jgi:formate dehydrogenase subunit gamma